MVKLQAVLVDGADRFLTLGEFLHALAAWVHRIDFGTHFFIVLCSFFRCSSLLTFMPFLDLGNIPLY